MISQITWVVIRPAITFISDSAIGDGNNGRKKKLPLKKDPSYSYIRDRNIIIIICYLYNAPQSASHMEEGNLLNHHQCAALTWMMLWQPYCTRTPTTHQLIGGEETE